MKKVIYFFVLVCLVLVPIGCTPEDKEEKTTLMISAAASLTDVLNELKPVFEDEYPSIELTFNFGGSGKLAQMIIQGAPSDVFLSASESDMDRLQVEDLILKETRVDFAENELVLIANKEQPVKVSSFNDINSAGVDHLAIGEPESVPVGRYTKQVLEGLNLWDSLQGSLVLGSDVRQVLTHVEMGNADAGIVYASDALRSEKVTIVATADSDWHEPIMYPGAVVSDTSNPDEAKEFLVFLASEKGQELLHKHGFK
ncbi:molybdate ABC transporter substrate-binding protein [Sporosarcina sp. Marseille-Q4063]|uniref:molybdate ABC transporter substrate-binding protein n=1 Tax=Sporosarcina sp. Marseille-Q4063 TaxID=2810514 RepID=UPI001BAF60A6|nr:molybdate ABC transporter substrate-binding protein [Sporosarcina sp. Marseille-Q4063]QUW20339.1 molybdate ABC transporter substrate-binding protein [Sporosarcina sp. Marseille-Q4063]